MKKRKKRNKPLIVILILFLSSYSFASEPNDDESLLFSYINAERIRENLPELVWDQDLYEVARSHSKDMASHNTMSHTGSDGSVPSERVRKAGIYVSKVGENVAHDVNVISAHTMLMRSLEHRKNMLNPGYTHAGVGIIQERNGLYVTELFARKIQEYSVKEARSILLETFDEFRKNKNMRPLILSDALTDTAQEHVELQEKNDRITTQIANPLPGIAGTRLVSVYTTDDLSSIPSAVQSDLETAHATAGIGVKKVRGSFCQLGCYLVVLIII